jgi:hypothetical protein
MNRAVLLRRLFAVVWNTFWFGISAWLALWLGRRYLDPFIKLPPVVETMGEWAFLLFMTLWWSRAVAYQVGLEEYADRYTLRRLWIHWRAAVAITRFERREELGRKLTEVNTVKPTPLTATPLPDATCASTVDDQISGITFADSYDDIDRVRLLEVLATWKDLRKLVRCFSVSPAAEYVTHVKFDGFVVGLSEDDVTLQIKDTEDLFLLSLQHCVTSQHEHITNEAYRLILFMKREKTPSFILSELLVPEQA